MELPYAQAKFIWPYLTYGTLVTVTPTAALNRRASIASVHAGARRVTAAPFQHANDREHAVPADKLHITLAGREHVVEAGTTAGQALEDQRTGDDFPERGTGRR